MSRDSTPPSRYSVLPPVTKNERDRLFLRELHDFLIDEMERCDVGDKKQRYIIHKAAFSKLIEHVTAYRPLLTRIKKAYDDVIKAIEKGKQDAGYLNDKLHSMAQEPSTLRNYRRRADQLDTRIEVLRQENERLEAEIRNLHSKRRQKEAPAKTVSEPKKKVSRKETRPVPGLTLEESTDIPTLQRELAKVESSIKELSVSKRSKFTERDRKESLKEKLSIKVEERDLLQNRNNWLQAKQKRLKVAHDAAMTYMRSTEPQYRSIGDVILLALAKNKSHIDDYYKLSRDSSGGTIEDDDPTKEKEAELVLEYIEKFNELFEDGRYEEAAIHAANSPKGILRTMETMARFKCVSAKDEGRSPWLAFCDAIMSSVLALGVKPSDTMSLECVQCALSENRLDLLSHWIAQERLTITEQLGDYIADHCKGKNRTYLDMAESIYRNCLAHKKVVHVIVRQGLYHRGLEYSKDKAFTSHDYFELLTKYPSSQLAYALCDMVDVHQRPLLPLGVMIRALIDANSTEVALQLLQKLCLRGPEETGTEYNGLRHAVFADLVTSQQQWQQVVKLAQDYGYEEVALDLLAAVTVSSTMRSMREASNVSGKSSEANMSSPDSSLRAYNVNGTDSTM